LKQKLCQCEQKYKHWGLRWWDEQEHIWRSDKANAWSEEVNERNEQTNDWNDQEMSEKKHKYTIASAFKLVLLCVCMIIFMKIAT
jgi:hypothetical protein